MLRMAHVLAIEDLSFERAEGEAAKLSDDRLAFGQQQVRQMLVDRPLMAKYVTEQDAVWQWAARQFAGESTPNKIYWSNDDPTPARADHFIPAADRPGFIRVASVNNGRPLDFEELWSCAIFELFNAANAEDFIATNSRASEGKIGREEFIRENFRLEFFAAVQTRHFYLASFNDVLRRHGLETNLEHWYLSDIWMGDWKHALGCYPKTSDYPWRVYSTYYDYCLWQDHAARRQSQKADAGKP
jgi:hypothetical protein